MLSGPELSRLLKEFEGEYLQDSYHQQGNQHHEQGFSTQRTFHKQVVSLSKTITQMGNPFLDEFPELVTLDKRNCMDESVASAMRTLEHVGKEQYIDYINNVILERTHSIHESIKKNMLPLFKRPQPKGKSKQEQKIQVLQSNVSIFGQLYVSTQNRDGDLQDFFAHESHIYPPALSDSGKLHSGSLICCNV
jgi:hypothetical protein